MSFTPFHVLDIKHPDDFCGVCKNETVYISKDIN